MKSNKSTIATNSNTKLINQQEMFLLQHSTIIRDTEYCGNLQYYILNKKYLTYKEVEESTELDTKAKILLLHNKKILIDIVNKEWTLLPTSDDATSGTRCQLCHKPLKVEYYIKNINTEEIIHIGSSCMWHFTNIDNFEKSKKEIEINRKKDLERKRKLAFEELEYKNNVFNFYNSAKEQYENLEIMLPKNHELTITNTLRLIQYYKNNYIQNDGDLERIFEQYMRKIQTYNKLINGTLNIVEQHKSKKLICKKIESDWLNINNKDARNEISLNGGFYTTSTLKYIINDHFIQEHLVEFNNRIKNPNIQIIDVKNGSMKFSYLHNKSKHPITFHIASRFFMQNIGCYCLTKDDFMFNENNLKDINLEQSQNNFYSLYNIMKIPMNKSYLDIEIYDEVNIVYYKKLPQTQFSHNRTRSIISEIKYTQITFQTFIVFCNDLIFLPDTEISIRYERLCNLYTNKNQWIDKKQKDEQISNLKNAPTYTKHRDFV